MSIIFNANNTIVNTAAAYILLWNQRLYDNSVRTTASIIPVSVSFAPRVLAKFGMKRGL